MQHWEFSNMPFDGDLTDDKIVCQNCGWSWKVKDGGDDLYVCHKCYTDNTSAYLGEKHSNFAVDPNAIMQAVGGIAQLGGGIAQSSAAKQASKTEIEREIQLLCGKRRGTKRKKAIYDTCAKPLFNKYKQNEQQRQQQQELLLKSSQQQKKNKTYLIIGAIALILGIVVYKKIKK